LTKSIIAHPAQETQSRIERGRKLFQEHADSIWCRDGVWLIPSENDVTSVYEVHLGREETCECIDWQCRSPEGGCKHIVAATLKRSKTFRCEGCGDRFPNCELFEAPEDHLAFFTGDALCRDCALHHGLL
jgi:hypothetical protein